MTKSNFQFLCVLFVGLVAAAGMWQFAGAQGEKVALGVKWEYTAISSSDTNLTKMNLLGKEGWELVGIEPAKPGLSAQLYFKRGR